MWRLSFLLFLLACSARSVEDYQDDGVAIQRQLVKELSYIDNIAELKEAVPRLRRHFNSIVELIIEADQRHSQADIAAKSSRWSVALRSEMIRIYEWEGGREVMELAQREALVRLDRSR